MERTLKGDVFVVVGLEKWEQNPSPVAPVHQEALFRERSLRCAQTTLQAAQSVA